VKKKKKTVTGSRVGQAALGACLNQSVLSPNGVFPGTMSFGNGHAIRDMGGCFVDLDGGEYLISRPLAIPEYNANMQLGPRPVMLLEPPCLRGVSMRLCVGVCVSVCRCLWAGFGSIVAGPGFPSNGFLITIGIQGSCRVPQVSNRHTALVNRRPMLTLCMSLGVLQH
jgi:hypothetical protein